MDGRIYSRTLYEMTDGEFTNEDILGGRAPFILIAAQGDESDWWKSLGDMNKATHQDFVDRCTIIRFTRFTREGIDYGDVPRSFPSGDQR